MKSRLVLPCFSYATNFHDKGAIAHKEVTSLMDVSKDCIMSQLHVPVKCAHFH